MINLFIKRFVKNYDDTENASVRESYCVLAGILGIACNLLLFLLKIAVGCLAGSIAVMSDAFNNLSDIGSSAVSIIGARLSNKKPDRDHPFGHGRFEYISALIVSFIIMLMGFELLKSSAEKVFSPEPLSFNLILIAPLLLSIPVKLWMYGYNRNFGRRISSGVLMAAAKDSINDVLATSAVVITTLIGRFFGIGILDGLVGIAVSLMILLSGFQIARDTVGLLLGTPPDKDTTDGIVSKLLAEKEIYGVHDLIVHDYGPGRKLASVHAEVSDDCDIVAVHEVIDRLERCIEADMGIHTVIHTDPVSVNSARVSELKSQVLKIAKKIDSRMGIHDFRITDGKENINLIFDLEIPADMHNPLEVKSELARKIRELDNRYSAVISVDTIYI